MNNECGDRAHARADRFRRTSSNFHKCNVLLCGLYTYVSALHCVRDISRGRELNTDMLTLIKSFTRFMWLSGNSRATG